MDNRSCGISKDKREGSPGEYPSGLPLEKIGMTRLKNSINSLPLASANG